MMATRVEGVGAFHAHLDACLQCREQPFALCSTGAALLEAAAVPGGAERPLYIRGAARTEAMHILIAASGLSWDQRSWDWSEVRECLQAREGLGPLRWQYRATWGRAAFCQFQVFAPAGSPPLVLVTEVEDNPGMSVTNAAERLVQEIAGALQFDLQTLRFVECYTTPLAGLPAPRFAAVTVEVTPEGRCLAPRWRHLALTSVADVAGAALALPAAARNLDTRACA